VIKIKKKRNEQNKDSPDKCPLLEICSGL